MPEHRRWPLFGILGLFVVLYFLFSSGARFYTDWLWFSSLGYQNVFLKIFLTEAGLKVAGGVLFFAFLYFNLFFTRRYILEAFKVRFQGEATLEPDQWYRLLGPRLLNLVFLLGSAVAALMFSALLSDRWVVLQQYLNPANFGVADPFFGKDVAFYLFKLPFYLLLYQLSFGAVVFTTVVVLLVYLGIDPLKGFGFWRSPGALRHLAFLGALLFGLKAWGYYLHQFLLFYSERGTIFGPGYTDIHASLLAIRILFVLALILTLVAVYGGIRASLRPALYGLGLLIAVSFGAGLVYPALLQKVVVEPNELERERPYIEKAIAFTRMAYNLDKIERRQFPAGKTLQPEDIEENQDAFTNVRLWDWQPLKQTYSQLQEMRLYYQFHDIDVDRYQVNGQYRQVMLAARELAQDQLPAQAQTWVNRHLKYTHGYGIAMSPVNEVTPEGLPRFFFKDIPPQTDTDLKLTRPEIYFGEVKAPYVIVNTKTGEFDYPKGDENVYTRYQGKGGVPIKNVWRRLAFAVSFADYRLLLSGDITHESRVLYYRDIETRVKKIAPFLRFDHDPYVVVADGRLFFLWDAYTASRWFPYAEPEGEFNYIRNAVKVVVDAYNGKVNFYLSEPDDPLGKSFSRIFPGLFRPLEEMPPEVLRHIRYPEDLFLIQARKYAVYHMQDPQVFYNKEDKWVLPTELFGTEEVRVEPYYIITRLPGAERPEFMLIIPFTPQNKKNMIAWLSARCDGENYGRLLVYEFPKQELVFGPMQVEARITQDAQISQQITLWDQRGSRVIRGNLLIIPVKDALIYVEPLYLQAEQSRMPELRRVILVHGDRIVMESSLAAALEKVFTGRVSPELPPAEDREERTVPELVQEASRAYKEAEEALKKGDWSGYGQNLERLKEVLEELEELTRQG
ncbi:MAG: UPF0182 family protein [Thermoanaerobacteraceae bacterium]|nr:UPF0182 family protein [Thermoanaerobacteraceae bacterium]